MVHEDVVKLDITMEDTATVTVGDAVDDLLEDAFGCLFVEILAVFNELEEVPSVGVFHDKELVLGALEDFEKPDDV